jgi:hypothetical protein
MACYIVVSVILMQIMIFLNIHIVVIVDCYINTMKTIAANVKNITNKIFNIHVKNKKLNIIYNTTEYDYLCIIT